MKVLMLNTFDEVGGAARAAVRLLQGVRGQGIDAEILVQFKTGSATEVLCHPSPLRKMLRRMKILVGLLPVRLYPNSPENNFSPALLPDGKLAEIGPIAPDVIHLHWLCAGFMRVETLAKLGRPLVWTLHDSWAFTGGCHVPFDCTRYRQRCGACPVLGSGRERDLSRWTWTRKERAWRELDLTVVAASRWMAESARSSSLFRDVRVERIPYGLDTGRFRPLDRSESRRLLGLPQDKKVILFGAVQAFSDPNKGFRSLQAALKIVADGSSDKQAVVFSSADSGDLPDLGMPALFLGRVDEERLPALYSAADVFVLPSRLDNFPLTVLEAMACGTPCVAFRQGGVSDMVEHEENGFLAQPYDAGDLARGITWVLEDADRHGRLSARSRKKVESEFTRELEAGRYAELYRELVAGK